MQIAQAWICDDKDEIEQMIEYWKPRLGISDWAINLDVRKMIDVPNQGVASSHWLLSRRTAWIVMSRSGTREDGTMPDDAEMSLVHELLHITLGAWHDSSRPVLGTSGVEYGICCEQPIDQLAETLVLMRRSTGHRFTFEG